MGVPVHSHRVSVVSGGSLVPGWKSYSVSVDILQPADSFSLSVQFTREAWALLKTDSQVEVFIDDTRILTGFIGGREKVPGDGTNLTITGRDKTGRLVDESADLFRYGGLYIKELAEKICDIGSPSALFDRVVLANTKNRSLLRSRRARKARAAVEPVTDSIFGSFKSGLGLPGSTIPDEGSKLSRRVSRPPIVDPGIFNGRSSPKRVQPGQNRWSVLEEFLREARLLAWSTADGRELFIGLPNYDQEVQYLFYEAAGLAGTLDRERTNCSIRVIENVEEMYSLYVACGAAKGNAANYGANVTKNAATVRDNPDTEDGTGINFRRPKTLMISDDGIKSQRDATERAEREYLQRAAGHVELEITTAGHGQIFAGSTATIYAVDTICHVIDRDTGIDAPFYITAVDFTSDEDGTKTTIRAVPKGTLLTL